MMRSVQSIGAGRSGLSQRAFPNQRRSLSASACHLAPYHYTTLPDRALLAISNKDSPKFLQGLITNDVNRIVNPKDGQQAAKVLYAGMLKADVSRAHFIHHTWANWRAA